MNKRFGGARDRVVLPVLGLVTAVVVSACTGASSGTGVATAGGGSGKPSASAASSTDPADQAVRFARCMREHGVDMPDPGSAGGPVVIGPGNADPATARAAEKACRHLAPGGREGPGQVDPAMQDRLLKFARCMREHGIDLPDPDPGGPGIALGGPGADSIDPSSKDFQAAQEACRDFLGPVPVESGS